MFGRDNAYSRLVFWLKILLPLAALAILSTIFLFSHSIDPSRALPFSKVNVAELAREPRIGGPQYSSVTRDGSRLTITALTARPDPGRPKAASARQVTAVLQAPDGRVTHLRADNGHVDSAKNRLKLRGDVRIDTSGDYRIKSPRLDAALTTTWVQADGGVTATAPIGRIDSRQMQILPDPAHPKSYVLVFKDRVRLLYRPAE